LGQDNREFIGEKWMSYLTQIGSKFCLRIKKDALITQKNARINKQDIDIEKYPLALYTQMLQSPSQVLTILDCEVYGHQGTLQATLSSDNNLVIVFTHIEVKQPLEEYRDRWGIEQMFESMKSYGFDLESTNLRDPDKLSKLVCFLTIAYCWSICVGECCKGAGKIKSHGRLEKSLFRRGLDTLQSVMRDGLSAIVVLLPYFSISRHLLPVLRL
jgi:hypothetical protein